MDALDQTLLAVVNYYYSGGFDQNAIAERLGISRTGVSRLIAQARERGYVSIRPRIPGTVRPGLAGFLAEHYGLRDVLIARIGSQEPETIRAHLGRIAACHLQSVFRDDLSLGISWGTSHTIEALNPTKIVNGRVVQLAGGLNPAEGFGPPLNELVQALAAKLGASPYYLFAPAIANSEATAVMLRNEHSIARELTMATSVDVALFGIGDLGPGNTIPIASALSSKEWSRIEAAGAVGAICVRFFDQDGQVAVPEIDARTIGLTLDQLAVIPTKIGVAGGLRKLTAALGALRGGLLDVLITDESLAEALLAECMTTRGDAPISMSAGETPSPVGIREPE